MKFYRVNVTPKGVLAFRENRKLKATIEKTNDGRYDCRCAFHNGEALGGTYDKKEDAIERTLQYLVSLDKDGEATFNGYRIPMFIFNMI